MAKKWWQENSMVIGTIDTGTYSYRCRALNVKPVSILTHLFPNSFCHYSLLHYWSVDSTTVAYTNDSNQPTKQKTMEPMNSIFNDTDVNQEYCCLSQQHYIAVSYFADSYAGNVCCFG